MFGKIKKIVLAFLLVPHVVRQVTGGLEDVSEGQWHSELTAADFNPFNPSEHRIFLQGTSTRDPLSAKFTV